jgi:hypothetical protein|tara:strand:+ start:476 stop:748 length:273 start_codon:yes stop_codon:yes gene_type:complete
MSEVTGIVQDAKAWWKSKTIIGAILAIIPTLARLINPALDIDANGLVDEVWAGGEEVAMFLDSAWAMALQGFGAVLAIWGRIKAKVSISS